MAFIKFANASVLEARIARHGDVRMARSQDRMRRTSHRHHFDYEVRPGFLYVRSRAISSRTNDNYDTFPAEEIREAWRTFIGKPVFVNHHNDDHRRARGVIIDAALHEDTAPDGTPDTWVEVLMEVDAVRFPKLAEAIVNGDIERTSMGCFVAGTLITMADGTRKPIEQIEVGDRVVTHRGNIEAVTYTMSAHHSGSVYDIRVYGQGSSLIATPEHPVWVRRVPPSDSKARRAGLSRPTACRCGRQFDTPRALGAHLREVDRHGLSGDHGRDESIFEGWVEARDVKVGDWVLSPAMSESGHPGNRSLARLLGYYLAEGSIGYDKAHYGEQPRWVQWDFHEDEVEYVAEVVACLSDLGYKASGPYVKNTCASVRCYSPELASQMLSLGGRLSWGKRLSPDVMGWSVDSALALVTAYWNGDGCYRNGRVEAGTASVHLAEQIHVLAVRCGFAITPPVKQHSPSAMAVGSRPKYVLQTVLDRDTTSTRRQVLSDEQGVWRQVTDVLIRDFDGMVYNFDVEGDDSYVAADVGVHNCDVRESECSVCGNVARTESQYCAHIKRMKGQRIRRHNASTGRNEDVLVHEVCFAPGTRVMLSDGSFAAIELIEPGQEVVDHRGLPARVESVISRSVDDDLVRIRRYANEESVLVTANHPILAIRRSDTAGGQRRWMSHRLEVGQIAPEFIPAGELRKGDFVCEVAPVIDHSVRKIVTSDWMIPDRVVERSHPEQVTPDRFYTPDRAWGGRQHILRACRSCGTEMDLYPSESDRLYCSSKCWGDGCARGNNAHGGSAVAVGLPDTVEMDRDFGRWCGWFLAEGSVSWQANRVRPSAVIFSLHRDEDDHAEEIARLGESIFGVPGVHRLSPTAKSRTVEFHNADLARLMLALGRDAYTKALPDEWINAPLDFINGVVSAHHDGDGSHGGGRTGGVPNPNVIDHATSSRRLADQLYVMHLILGHTPTRKKSDPPFGASKRTVPGRYVTARSDGDMKGRMTWGQWVFAPIKEVEVVPYTGIVHNLVVAGSHTYTAEGVAVHNCRGLAFFENSLLVEPPADPTAFFLGVDTRGIGRTAARQPGARHAAQEGKMRHVHGSIGWSLGPVNDVGATYQIVSPVEVPDLVPEPGFFFARSAGAGERVYVRGTGRTRRQWGRDCPTFEVYAVQTSVIDGAVWGTRGERHAGIWVTHPDALPSIRSVTATRHHAYGETVAPAAINTLRQMECPVCGTDDSWDGTGNCRVCGYLPPPEPFREPDLEVAQRVNDHRGDWFDPGLMSTPPFLPPAG